MPTDLAADGHTSLAHRAYRELRDRLILLEIPLGSAISEGPLAAELGVGRTPLREALKHLELDHLVVSYPRRGTFATRVDITDLSDISEVRRELEPIAAARAARHAGPTTRAEMAEKARQIATLAPDATDRVGLIQFDLKVHRLIYRAAGNEHLTDTLVRLDNLATRIWCVVLDRIPSVSDHIDEHVELLQGILDGDPDRAAELARRHVEHFERAVVAALSLGQVADGQPGAAAPGR